MLLHELCRARSKSNLFWRGARTQHIHSEDGIVPVRLLADTTTKKLTASEAAFQIRHALKMILLV